MHLYYRTERAIPPAHPCVGGMDTDPNRVTPTMRFDSRRAPCAPWLVHEPSNVIFVEELSTAPNWGHGSLQGPSPAHVGMLNCIMGGIEVAHYRQTRPIYLRDPLIGLHTHLVYPSYWIRDLCPREYG